MLGSSCKDESVETYSHEYGSKAYMNTKDIQ